MTEQSGQRRGRPRSLNRVQIIGNLGRDPEMRFTQGGTPVANFSVAVNENWQTRDGQQQEHTEWFRVVAWTRLAEIANEYLRRGTLVFVEGNLRSREWQDREGNNRTSVELIARDFLMLSGRDEGVQRDDYDGQRDGGQSASPAVPTAASPAVPAASPAVGGSGGQNSRQDAGFPAGGDDISPDDLPF